MSITVPAWMTVDVDKLEGKVVSSADERRNRYADRRALNRRIVFQVRTYQEPGSICRANLHPQALDRTLLHVYASVHP